MRELKQVKTLSAPNASRTSNEEKSDRFPSGRVYRAILKFAFTITQAGGAAAGTLAQDAPFTYLRRIRVVIGGREVINVTGQQAYNLAQLLDGVAPPSTAPAGSLNAAHACSGELPLYFAPPDSLVPEVALLASHGKLDPQIFVEYGVRTDVYTGGDGTFTVSAESNTLVCEFETSEINPGLVAFMSNMTETINAAQTDFPVELPFGDGLRYRGAMIMATRAGARSDTQITEVVLKAGEAILEKVPWSTLQAETRRIFKIAPPTGIAMLWWDRTKRWQRLLDTKGLGQLRLELNVIAPSGTTNVQVVPLTVRDAERLIAA